MQQLQQPTTIANENEDGNDDANEDDEDHGEQQQQQAQQPNYSPKYKKRPQNLSQSSSVNRKNIQNNKLISIKYQGATSSEEGEVESEGNNEDLLNDVVQRRKYELESNRSSCNYYSSGVDGLSDEGNTSERPISSSLSLEDLKQDDCNNEPQQQQQAK